MSKGGSFERPCFRPDGRLIVTGGCPIRIWQVPSGKPLGAVAPMTGGERPMFLPDGKVLIEYCNIIASVNKQLIDVAPGLEPVALGAGFGDEYYRLAFAPDGRTMVRTYLRPEQRREFCRLYDLSDGKAIGESRETEGYEQGYERAPEPSFSADGRRVATVVGSNDCQILDTTTGREQVPRMAMDRRIRALAFSPDGHLLATGDDQGAVRLWNAATGQAVGPLMTQPPVVEQRNAGPSLRAQPIERIRFSPDGRTLLIAGGGLGGVYGFARLWDTATGQPLGPESEVSGVVRAARFSPDGKSFATGAFQLTLWDATTSRKIWTAPSTSSIRQLAFTADGRKVLASHDEENAARLYDARTGEPVTPLLRHHDVVVSSALSPDGRLVVTSSMDHTVRLWDASLGLPVGPAWPTSSGGSVSFTPDGRGVLMIGDANGLVRWEIPPPVEGTPERIRLTIEAATRASLDPFGATVPLYPLLQLDPATKRAVLSSDPFEPVGKRLQELGGPTGAFRR
ncbi:WD40 repeat domain-containing protein [Paludisphaera mucosa]|uniref:WD40 repeat domain-containing protein n=1 Tax=Paludisphaera mucosa TaxID=3030827 RepID=A0ABT6F7T7_9BACT|nr:LpqB family beta-propeller domain-containing protein [Paludisphaera mucosa]MDG3003651.1 hypothetical protein [Paludisphaera mucosa]